jgi:X-Pro dipeptidyl-peptidase-like protein
MNPVDGEWTVGRPCQDRDGYRLTGRQGTHRTTMRLPRSAQRSEARTGGSSGRHRDVSGVPSPYWARSPMPDPMVRMEHAPATQSSPVMRPALSSRCTMGRETGTPSASTRLSTCLPGSTPSIRRPRSSRRTGSAVARTTSGASRCTLCAAATWFSRLEPRLRPLDRSDCIGLTGVRGARDARALVDYLATLPEVQKDRPGDQRFGMRGASYGGGITLMAASYDRRIDAIVPVVTWNSLAQSLSPNFGSVVAGTSGRAGAPAFSSSSGPVTCSATAAPRRMETKPAALTIELGNVPTADVIAALVRAGVRLHSAAARRPLEDVFLNLVDDPAFAAGTHMMRGIVDDNERTPTKCVTKSSHRHKGCARVSHSP